jgi:hypothetical protein
MSTSTAGPARVAFERLMAPFVAGLRLGGAVATGVGAPLGLVGARLAGADGDRGGAAGGVGVS